MNDMNSIVLEGDVVQMVSDTKRLVSFTMQSKEYLPDRNKPGKIMERSTEVLVVMKKPIIHVGLVNENHRIRISGSLKQNEGGGLYLEADHFEYRHRKHSV